MIPVKIPPTTSVSHMTYQNHILTKLSLTVILDDNGKKVNFTVNKNADPIRYQSAISAIKEGKFTSLPEILDRTLAISKVISVRKGWSSATDGTAIAYNDVSIPDRLFGAIRASSSEGYCIEPYLLFWEKASQNESSWSKMQLFDFIDRNGVTITNNGNFLLYKGVNSDMKSFHDKTTLHQIGVRMPDLGHANLDPQVCCGRGYHAAPWQYVNNHYSGHIILEVEINPAEVISVPHSDARKIRCWNYVPTRVVPNGVNGKRDQQLVKTGTLAEPVIDKTESSGIISSAKKIIRKVAAKFGGVKIDATTDRITIPSSLIIDHGIQPGGIAVVWATDPRSRFVYVCSEALFGSLPESKKTLWKKEVLVLSTGNLSIRAAVLAQAKIWEQSGRTYKVSSVGPKLLEVRLA